MPNIEIKARYRDLESARLIALRFGASYLGEERQIDTYFRTRQGRLKLRESSRHGASLIPYRKDYRAGPTRSDYAVIPVTNPDATKALLGDLLGTVLVVDKRRDVFVIENLRIHLDQVQGLGSFLEFEAVFETDTPEIRDRETERIREAMGVFGVREKDLIDRSYLDLLLEREKAKASEADPAAEAF